MNLFGPYIYIYIYFFFCFFILFFVLFRGPLCHGTSFGSNLIGFSGLNVENELRTTRHDENISRGNDDFGSDNIFS